MSLTDTTYDEEYEVFLCAGCESEWTCHKKVEVFFRVEDADEGTHVKVSTSSVQVDHRIKDEGNPSTRRSGIKVYLTCETCDAITIFSISQHKGQTLMTKEVVLDINEYAKSLTA